MGSSRASQETKDTVDALEQSKNAARRKRELESKLKSLDAQMDILNSEYEMQKEELDKLASEDMLRIEALAKGKTELTRRRGADKSR